MFLLAMQAAGMVVDYLGTKNQIEMGRMGTQLEQAGIESNLENVRLQSADASLQAMQELRQNLGSQIALMAARGTASYAGSALVFRNESINNFNSDERMRRLNLLGKQTSLKGQGMLSKLNQNTSESQLWSSFTKRSLNRFPGTSEGFGGTIKALGK